MAAWWTLTMKPTRSCLRPSTTHASHSGRERSSGTDGDLAGDRAELAPAAGGRAGDRGARGSRGRSRGPRSTPGGGTGTAPRRAGGGTAARRAAGRRCAASAPRTSSRRASSTRRRCRPWRRACGRRRSPGRGRSRPVRTGVPCVSSLRRRGRARPAPFFRVFRPDVGKAAPAGSRGCGGGAPAQDSGAMSRRQHVQHEPPRSARARQAVGRWTSSKLLRQGLVRAGLVANAYRPSQRHVHDGAVVLRLVAHHRGGARDAGACGSCAPRAELLRRRRAGEPLGLPEVTGLALTAGAAVGAVGLIRQGMRSREEYDAALSGLIPADELADAAGGAARRCPGAAAHRQPAPPSDAQRRAHRARTPRTRVRRTSSWTSTCPSTSPRAGREATGGAADPRWRLGARLQGRAGHPAAEPPGVVRLGRLQRRLPPEPAGEVPGPPRRLQEGARVDPRARRRVRRRPRLHRRHRRLGRRAPVRPDGADPERSRSSSRASRTPTPRCRRRCRSTASTT